MMSIHFMNDYHPCHGSHDASPAGRGKGRCGLWEELLAARDEDWLDLLAAGPDQAEDWLTPDVLAVPWWRVL
jgi:hypothetical protein